MEKRKSKISKELYDDALKLALQGKFLSAEIVVHHKGNQVRVNGNSKSNKEFERLEEGIDSWFYDNEFMFGGAIFPIINEGQLSFKICFEISSGNYNDIDIPWDFSSLFESVHPMLQKHLNTSLKEENLLLSLDMNRKSTELVFKKYSLFYLDGQKKIKLTGDPEIRDMIVAFTSQWCESNIYETSESDLSYHFRIINSEFDAFLATWSNELVLIVN